MSRAAAETDTGRLITGDELFEMGDIGPCELIDGRIVPISPTRVRQGAIEILLASALHEFVRSRNLGVILGGEVGIYIRRDPDGIRGADIAFISFRRLGGGPVPKKYLEVAPEFVAEIISPDDRWEDIRSKIADYFSIGVERVWIVEPKDATVLVYRSETEMEKLVSADTLRGEGVLEGFALTVAELFQEPGAVSKG